MRILIIKQLWNPEPTAKSMDFAKELVNRGHSVQVLTGFPNYPTGKIYDGYKQSLFLREDLEGIEVIRVPVYPSHSSSAIKRILNYFSFAITASILGPFLCRKANISFAYQGAMTVSIPAIVMKLTRRIPYIYDVNDLWPETLVTSGMIRRSWIINALHLWDWLNVKLAAHVTVATNGFLNRYLDKGLSKDKFTIVSNWSRDEFASEQLDDDTRLRIFPVNTFNILYAGNLGVVQSLKTVIDGVLEARQMSSKEIQLVLIGDGAEKKELKLYVRSNNFSFVQFIDRVSSGVITKYLNSADCLVVHLKKDPIFERTIPSKILSYMRTGKPVLLGLSGEASELIHNANAGLSFEPEESSDLAEKILKLIKEIETKVDPCYNGGPSYYNTYLSMEASVDKLEQLFYKKVR